MRHKFCSHAKAYHTRTLPCPRIDAECFPDSHITRQHAVTYLAKWLFRLCQVALLTTQNGTLLSQSATCRQPRVSPAHKGKDMHFSARLARLDAFALDIRRDALFTHTVALRKLTRKVVTALFVHTGENTYLCIS